MEYTPQQDASMLLARQEDIRGKRKREAHFRPGSLSRRERGKTEQGGSNTFSSEILKPLH